MRLKPSTLLGRIMILITSILIVGQISAFKLFEYLERDPRAQDASMQVVTIVNFTKAALLASHENRRIAFLSEMSGKEGVRVYAFDLLETVEPLPNDPYVQLIASKIRDKLGKDTSITINHLGIPGLWVSFTIEQDDYWVVIPRFQAERTLPLEWLGWAALVALLSFAGAYLIAARINRPLNLLVKAAERIRKNQSPIKLPEEGPDEFRNVNQTFNHMSEALTRLDAERTLLLAGVSHDLRTPLTRLRLAVEMLPDEFQTSFKDGMIEDIGDMDNIINQFLDFVRGVEGEPTQMLDINDSIQRAAEKSVRAGHQVDVQLSPSLTIPLRPMAIQRLLGNLIDNALYYSKKPVMVRSTVESGHIIISVLDEGPGIPQEHLERLLRPFERMDKARGNVGGSGLGLAICDRIAKLHGGKLVLRNRPTGGLEARVTLPAS